MARQRISLNLYLLKRGVAPADAARGVPASDTEGDPAVPSTGWVDTWILGSTPERGPLPNTVDSRPALLVRGTPPTNSWQALLQSLAPDVPLGGEGENHGALLFQPVGADTVIWSFGNGWSLIDIDQTVERFGLRTALNALITAQPPAGGSSRQVGVRGLTSAIRAAVVRRSTVVAARPSKPTSFERVDQSSDAAAVAEVTTHHSVFDRASGGRSLRFEAAVSSLADLERYAREALRLHRRRDYTTDDAYAWIDYTVPVTSRQEIDAVLDELGRVAARGSAAIDMVWADQDPTTGLTPYFVCFPNERSGRTAPHRTHMSWPSAWQWLQANRPGIPGSDALRTSLRFFEAVGRPGPEVELWRLVVAQVALGRETYFVSDGEIWRASATHIRDINNLLAPYVDVEPSWLPKYQLGELEGDYNVRVAAQPAHALLDKRLLRLPSQTPFEPCDVLSADGRLLHVKRKTGSSTMSHVVAQALASTQLLRMDVDARDKLDEVLRNISPAPARLREMRDHCLSFASRPTASVYVVVIGQWRGRPALTQLPLLTRVALNSWIRQMSVPSRVALVGT